MESNADVPLPLLGMECPYQTDGRFQYLRRIHTTSTGPFCYTEVYLERNIYRQHPARYRHSTVAPVLDELHGEALTHAGQLLTIIEAGADSAEALHLPRPLPSRSYAAMPVSANKSCISRVWKFRHVMCK